MKRIFAILLFAIFLMSCTQSKIAEDSHTGCSEKEIDENGNCVPSEKNNADLFSQDLSSVSSYYVEGEVRGFLARPAKEGDYPGVIMIHEWWGLNQNIEQMAKILAKEGYAVFAIDLYDGEVASEAGKARELSSKVRENPQAAVEKMKRAVAYLEEEHKAKKIGSLGWCFGGGQSLQLSLNEDLDATVIYYGTLVTDESELRNINSPVLGIFGSEDTGIPVETVNRFDSALDSLGIDNQIYIYPGVGHAFANPSGSNYAKDETEDAWKKTVGFLEQNLKGD